MERSIQPPQAAAEQKRKETHRKQQAALDDALDDSFPASDPPSQTVPMSTQKADPEHLVDAAKASVEGKKEKESADNKKKSA